MKRMWKQVLGLCAMALLLCGALSVSALAAGPGQLQVNLTYTGVGSGAGVANGAPVTAGYAALLEDGAQVTVNGKLLTEIVNGSVTFNYAFDAGKTYEVAVQEGMTAPYYEAKTIAITPQNVAAAIATGAVITDTVNWVEWGKPIKVTLVDSMGLPVPTAGIGITLTATDADPINPTYQTVEVTKATNADGTATFYDFSYDPNDANMRNIHTNRIFVSAKCGDTTVAQFYDLAEQGSNCVTLCWPTATVSGIVRNVNGQPEANQRVAAYFQMMTPMELDSNGHIIGGESMIKYYGDYVDPSTDTSTGRPKHKTIVNFPLKGQVYYTTTDANGNYTLALPEGVSATLCVDNATLLPSAPTGVISWYTDVVNYDYASKASNHFPWIRTMFVAGDEYGNTFFKGIQCMEMTPVTCVPYGAMGGYDLAIGRTQYTLKGTVQAGDELYNGTLLMNLTSAAPTQAATLHRGGLTERSLSGGVTNGVINKTDVKLVPGTYEITIANDKPEEYVCYTTQSVTITAADVATGTVDLGFLYFLPIQKAPIVGSYPGSTHTIVVPTPDIVTGPDYGYLRTRLEKVEDPAYGGDSYQITLHYTAFHTNLGVSKLDNASLTVELPAGISVNNAGGMSVSGSAASGITLTKSLTNVPVGKVEAIVFSVRVEASSSASYYAITCRSAPNLSGEMEEELTSAVTLQRLRINLNGPRLVATSTPFTVFGDLTGAGENTGVRLFSYKNGVGTLMATGAKKGRYFFFDVNGQQMGSYTLRAKTDRNNAEETSNSVVVTVGSGLPKVEDMYIMADGRKISKNSSFGMVYYTAFVDPGDLTGPSFDVFVKVDNITSAAGVKLEVLGRSYNAVYDAATGYWKATVSDYAAYGDYDLMLTIDGNYTTQIGRLLLLF